MSGPLPSLGSGSRAFPLPSIAEDTLHYVLHLPSSSSFSPSTSPSSPSSSSTTTSDPTALATLITAYVESLLPSPWLWNKDSWELKVQGGKLEGTMRVGDAVDDEWCVVWLLREVSRKWPELVIGVRDTDGEFLLIEAANELPSWVSPENAENRLWLKDGHLHLIPLHVRSSKSSARTIPDDEALERQYDPEAYLNEQDAVAAVRTGKHRADQRMEYAVWERIASYPGALNTHQHRTKAWLPVPIARALRQSPELVQKAVESFYVRDPAQLRAASRMTHFPPSPAVLAPVQMTRAAYAQLQGQVLHPPRVFGPEWHVREGAELDDERRWRDLGVKLATGFEIMYREGGRKDRSGQVDGAQESLEGDEEYRKYLQTLMRAGFFGEEREGSQKWKERQAEARKGWISARASDVTSQRASFAYLVDQAIASTSSVAVSALEATPNDLEDSEAWLEVSPDELDGMMQRASGRTSGPTDQGEESPKAEVGEEHGKALQDLADKVKQFVGGEGDVEGAKFADELSDDDIDDDGDDDGDGVNETGDEVDEDEDMEDPWAKMTAQQKEEHMRNLVPAVPLEEWGAKPAKMVEDSSDVVTVGGAPAATTAINARTGKPKKSVTIQEPTKASSDSPPLTNMRPPTFEKMDYDGVVSESSDEEDDEADLPAPGSLGRRIAEMKWGDGASPEEIEAQAEKARSDKIKWDDDKIDEEMRRRIRRSEGGATVEELEDDEDVEEGQGKDEEAVNGKRRVKELEQGDVDMGEEEEEFLKFSREALGITDDLWDRILGERRERGAFVPVPKAKGKNATDGDVGDGLSTSPKKAKTMPVRPAADLAPAPPTHGSGNGNGNGGVNMALDSFDKVMQAMDAELARARSTTSASQPGPDTTNPNPYPKKKLDLKSKSKANSTSGANTKTPSTIGRGKSTASANPLPPLPTEADLEDMSEDDLLAMDRELRAALKSAGIEDEDEPEEAAMLDGEQRQEYEMMRDFLESYKSQGGASGAVGNLFGRLGGGGRG